MGKDIKVYLGDITTLDVDVIVNAAHAMLLGGGGVDGAIHRKAGEKLIQECMNIPIFDGIRCKDGHAHMTKAYDLPCKYVIHTVAPKFVGGLIRREIDGVMKPIFKNNNPEKDMDLANCYKNSLRLADKNGLESIAFPSLGTGGHAYPIEVACPIAINTVNSHLGFCKNIKQVIFVCFSQNDYDFYLDELKKGEI